MSNRFSEGTEQSKAQVDKLVSKGVGVVAAAGEVSAGEFKQEVSQSGIEKTLQDRLPEEQLAKLASALSELKAGIRADYEDYVEANRDKELVRTDTATEIVTRNVVGTIAEGEIGNHTWKKDDGLGR